MSSESFFSCSGEHQRWRNFTSTELSFWVEGQNIYFNQWQKYKFHSEHKTSKMLYDFFNYMIKCENLDELSDLKSASQQLRRLLAAALCCSVTTIIASAAQEKRCLEASFVFSTGDRNGCRMSVFMFAFTLVEQFAGRSGRLGGSTWRRPLPSWMWSHNGFWWHLLRPRGLGATVTSSRSASWDWRKMGCSRERESGGTCNGQVAASEGGGTEEH